MITNQTMLSWLQSRNSYYFLLILSILSVISIEAQFQAGVSKVDGTPPIGVPLAGYNHGKRRVPHWPLPSFNNYTTFMEPSVGILDPSWVKCLVIDDGNGERFAFVTMDAIGADGNIEELAYLMASQQGFSVPLEKIVFSGSHTHSGPGALSPEMLWALAPATDVLVPTVQKLYASALAKAMLEAEKALQPAKIDIGMGILIDVTVNRRAPNPWLRKDTIDPNLGVMRIDTSDGKPLAILWNFAMHGVCYGPDNMNFSSDIAGATCNAIEELMGGVALFVNGDAGDIDPSGEVCGCSNGECSFSGAKKIASSIQNVAQSLNPTPKATIRSASQVIPFGSTNLNLTLERLKNCTHGGPLDICTICWYLHCDANLHLPESWVEENPRFTALNFLINGKKTAMVTMPGEALVELGWWIRNDTQNMDFDQTFLLGYSNNHLGYFATPNEYEYGGYESTLTLWGEETAAMVRNACLAVLNQVKSISDRRR